MAAQPDNVNSLAKEQDDHRPRGGHNRSKNAFGHCPRITGMVGQTIPRFIRPISLFFGKINFVIFLIFERMIFKIDKQTYGDLQIFGAQGSIEFIFNQTRTEGGKNLIHQLMKSPTSDEEELYSRSSTIKFFSEINCQLGIDKRRLNRVEYYLSLEYPTFPKHYLNTFVTSVKYFLNPSSEVYNVLAGIEGVISVLRSLHQDLENISLDTCPPFLKKQFIKALKILNSSGFKNLINVRGNGKLFLQILEFDSLLRSRRKNEVRFLIELIYEMDAYSTVANVVNKRRLSFPEFLPNGGGIMLNVKGLFHLSIENPIANDVTLDDETSLCLITGPNMAGKSTFLRALGICVYLAHIGFPVPANQMKSSIFHGLATTINLTDDLAKGYSHFYSELMRVKEVVNYIKEYKKIVIIFDELFRGTNVKDAYDGTLLLSRHLAELTQSKIFISTHIIEVIENLRDNEYNGLMKYFDARMSSNGVIKYDYFLKDGISNQRLGYQLIKNEKILEILSEIVKSEKKVK